MGRKRDGGGRGGGLGNKVDMFRQLEARSQNGNKLGKQGNKICCLHRGGGVGGVVQDVEKSLSAIDYSLIPSTPLVARLFPNRGLIVATMLIFLPTITQC